LNFEILSSGTEKVAKYLPSLNTKDSLEQVVFSTSVLVYTVLTIKDTSLNYPHPTALFIKKGTVIENEVSEDFICAASLLSIVGAGNRISVSIIFQSPFSL
jgi:hypothetical protein